MKEAEHRRQMLVQQIADHRERLRLEVRAIQESNPARPLIIGGRRLLGAVNAIRTGRSLDAGSASDARRAGIELELLSAALPVILPIVRALLHRYRDRRARKKGT